MRYRLQIRPSALRDLGRLPAADRKRVVREIDGLAEDPRPAGCRKLRTMVDCYRIRVGVYRVVYLVQDEVVTVTVVRVRHRREAYRGL